MITRVSRVSRLPDAVWSRLGEGGVIVDVRSGGHFELNEVALFIWSSLDGRKSLGEIASQISERYEVGERSAFTDVKGFVASLCKRGLASVF